MNLGLLLRRTLQFMCLQISTLFHFHLSLSDLLRSSDMYRFNSLIFGSRVFGCSVCRIICCLSRDSRLCIMQDCHWRAATCDMPPTGPLLLAFCGLWPESPTLLTVINVWLVTSCECHSPYLFPTSPSTIQRSRLCICFGLSVPTRVFHLRFPPL